MKQLTKGEYKELFSYTSFSLEACFDWLIFISGVIVAVYFWINCRDYRAENKEIRQALAKEVTSKT